MKQVTTQINFKLKGDNYAPNILASWDINVEQRNDFFKRAIDTMRKKDESEFVCEVSIVRRGKMKTNPQMRYLWGIVYPAFYREFERLSGRTISHEHIRRQLKLNEDVQFVEDVENPLTGEFEIHPKSCADAEIDEVTYFIDCLLGLAAKIDLKISTPEEWCKANGISYQLWKQYRDENAAKFDNISNYYSNGK